MGMIGKNVGRLTIKSHSHTDKERYWCCECECGKQSVHSTRRLNEAMKLGSNIGCECFRLATLKKAIVAATKANTRHGLCHSKLHYMYDNMVKRCYTPSANRYDRYGGRGITVCDEWKNNRSSFYEWALSNKWREGLSLDRIDIDGHYCPDNCRFIPLAQQANNTSRNRFLEWQGKRQTVAEWARELNINAGALQHRVDRGWSLERIFTQPYRGRGE